jgi:glyoxylase-like metal-dependent hydrolase (beta-lactamase superfamily II)
MALEENITRRLVLKAALGGGAGLVLGVPARLFGAQADSPAIRLKPPAYARSALARSRQSLGGGGDSTMVERLADDLYVIHIPGESNIVAHTSSAGVLLVDGGSTRAADAVTKAVASLPGSGPVHTLFNTHWHPEQTGLNEQIGKAKRTIIAQENTRLWLSTDVTWPWNGQTFVRLPKIAQPNKTFYDKGQLDSGIRYGYIPDCAHTDGDLYVYFPQQNVLAVGDVVSGQGWPAVDWTTGGWIGGMVGGLQRVLSLTNEQTRIVPGRGPVLGLDDLKKQFEMYQTLYERLTQLLNKGRGPGEAVEAKPAKEFEAEWGNADEFVRRSFESLWAYLSPDA